MKLLLVFFENARKRAKTSKMEQKQWTNDWIMEQWCSISQSKEPIMIFNWNTVDTIRCSTYEIEREPLYVIFPAKKIIRIGICPIFENSR